MKPTNLRALSGMLFLFLLNLDGLAQSSTLSSPIRRSDQIQFTLTGEAYRHYVIQSSSNLVNWIALTTNVSQETTRPLSFAASNTFGFYRSALWTRTNSINKAIQLTGSFDLNGENFAFNSFDSSDPAFSTNGLYDPSKSRDTGELSLDSGMTNSLGFGNVIIQGNVATGPGTPLMIGPNGSIGDFAWLETTNGIQPGKVSIDLNPYFREVKDPFPNGGYSTSAPGESVTNIVNSNMVISATYDYVFESGNYRLPELGGKVLVRGNARVHITDYIQLNGNDSITITTNASLQLYAGASIARLNGSGVIIQNENATNFIYYGMPGNTNLDIGGNTSFTGIIYAPQADVFLGGGGNDTYDFIGAIVAHSLMLNGHFNFHYDEALQGLSFPE